MKYVLALIVNSLFSMQLLAFPCVFTVIKASCWKEYTLNVTVKNLKTEKELVTISVPKGKLWQREQIACTPGEKIIYTANFTPAIGEGTEKETYRAQRIWMLPETLKPEAKEWELKICFPHEFSRVPFPPTAGSDCACDKESIPALPLLPN